MEGFAETVTYIILSMVVHIFFAWPDFSVIFGILHPKPNKDLATLD